MLYDRVSFSTATAGTGTITVGAATTNFRTMAGATIPDGTTVQYTIEDGAAWETGSGVTGASATTLTRVLSQSSTGALLVLSGTAKCFLTPIASQYNALNSGTVSVVLGRIRRAANQSIATGPLYTDLSWDTASDEIGGDFWTSGATITIPEAGYYQIDVEATFEGAAVAVTCNMQLLVGAVVIGDDERMVAASATAALIVAVTRLFAAGDVLKVQVKHSSATALNVLAQGDHSPDITVTKIGGAIGAAPGATTQIIYNDAGAFAGDADFTWNKTTNQLSMIGTDTGFVVASITNEPATPAAGQVVIYAKSYAAKMQLKIKGPSGLDFPLQTALWGNNVSLWTPTGATGGLWTGTVGAGTGTFTTGLPTVTNIFTSLRRSRWANVVTTVNQVLGQRNTDAMYWRGSVANQGGFFFYARGGFDVWTNGGRFFAGMHSATTVISADPSALNNTVGFCVDAADNGLISFLTRGTAATKASTGLTITSNAGYDFYIFCVPNSNQYTWLIVDLNTGTRVTGTATVNLPTNTVMLTAGVLASNAALTPVTSIQVGLNRIYVETDY